MMDLQLGCGCGIDLRKLVPTSADWCDAADACDELLSKAFRIELEKALDPLKQRDFETIVRRVTTKLRRKSGPIERDAVQRAVEKLDIDWRGVKAAVRTATLKRVSRIIERTGGIVWPAIDEVFELEAEKIVKGTRRSVNRSMRLGIGVTTDALDRRVTRYVSDSQRNFITDQYKDRSVIWDVKARDTVNNGLKEGLSSRDIGNTLSRQMQGLVTGRSKHYYNVVANAFSVNARSYSHIASFHRAKIDRYEWVSIVDARTTPICRMLSGKIFTVERAMEVFLEVEKERDPTKIVDSAPWVRRRGDDLFVNKGGKEHPIARIKDDASGTNRRGSFQEQPIEAVAALGVVTPPAHGLCRSTILAA